MNRWMCCLVAAVAAVSASPAAADTKVGPKGQFYVNGQAVIPLGVWQQPEYLFDYHKQLGMTCLVWPPGSGNPRPTRREYLLQAHRRGLGAIVHYEPNLVALPAVWGWVGGGNSLDQTRQRYQQLRREDGNHIVQVNFRAHEVVRGQQADHFRQALRCTDSVVSHVWPEMFEGQKRDLRHVATLVDRLREYCKDRPGGEVSIWPDINPHLWFGKKQRDGRQEQYPAPTPEELRFQVWLALIHGADGVCFFPISFDPFVFAQIPARGEQEMAATSRLVGRFAEALAAEESPLRIRAVGASGGIVDFTTRRLGETDYVFLLNGQAEGQTVRLEVEGLGTARTLRDAISDRPVPARDGSHQEDLKGLELRIWRLDTAPDRAGGAARTGQRVPTAVEAAKRDGSRLEPLDRVGVP